MKNTCENCALYGVCRKTIGVMFGYCTIDFVPKKK